MQLAFSPRVHIVNNGVAIDMKCGSPADSSLVNEHIDYIRSAMG